MLVVAFTLEDEDECFTLEDEDEVFLGAAATRPAIAVRIRTVETMVIRSIGNGDMEECWKSVGVLKEC